MYATKIKDQRARERVTSIRFIYTLLLAAVFLLSNDKSAKFVEGQFGAVSAVLSVVPVTSILTTAGLVGVKLAAISRLLQALGYDKAYLATGGSGTAAQPIGLQTNYAYMFPYVPGLNISVRGQDSTEFKNLAAQGGKGGLPGPPGKTYPAMGLPGDYEQQNRPFRGSETLRDIFKDSGLNVQFPTQQQLAKGKGQNSPVAQTKGGPTYESNNFQPIMATTPIHDTHAGALNAGIQNEQQQQLPAPSIQQQQQPASPIQPLLPPPPPPGLANNLPPEQQQVNQPSSSALLPSEHQGQPINHPSTPHHPQVQTIHSQSSQVSMAPYPTTTNSNNNIHYDRPYVTATPPVAVTKPVPHSQGPPIISSSSAPPISPNFSPTNQNRPPLASLLDSSALERASFIPHPYPFQPHEPQPLPAAQPVTASSLPTTISNQQATTVASGTYESTVPGSVHFIPQHMIFRNQAEQRLQANAQPNNQPASAPVNQRPADPLPGGQIIRPAEAVAPLPAGPAQPASFEEFDRLLFPRPHSGNNLAASAQALSASRGEPRGESAIIGANGLNRDHGAVGSSEIVTNVSPTLPSRSFDSPPFHDEMDQSGFNDINHRRKRRDLAQSKTTLASPTITTAIQRPDQGAPAMSLAQKLLGAPQESLRDNWEQSQYYSKGQNFGMPALNINHLRKKRGILAGKILAAGGKKG